MRCGHGTRLSRANRARHCRRPGCATDGLRDQRVSRGIRLGHYGEGVKEQSAVLAAQPTGKTTAR